ncbi:MAG TPA: hypothetical protein VHZ55_06825 [Bryobacteraceae bacterium]|nr:hypothetical protein [Bryobacteraceae bacterium]
MTPVEILDALADSEHWLNWTRHFGPLSGLDYQLARPREFASAKAYLKRLSRVLGPQIDAGFPIVILEPSCASVFRNELPNLVPADPRAGRLRRQTLVLSRETSAASRNTECCAGDAHCIGWT